MNIKPLTLSFQQNFQVALHIYGWKSSSTFDNGQNLQCLNRRRLHEPQGFASALNTWGNKNTFPSANVTWDAWRKHVGREPKASSGPDRATNCGLGLRCSKHTFSCSSSFTMMETFSSTVGLYPNVCTMAMVLSRKNIVFRFSKSTFRNALVQKRL